MIAARGDGLGDITRDLYEAENAFDFIRHRMGNDIMEMVSQSVLAMMDAECDPDGIPWPELSESYLAWKVLVAPGAEIGRLHGVMKDPAELRGESIVNPKQIDHWYGVSAQAKREAVKFQEGGLVTGTNQPPRPFWAINRHAAVALDGYFDTVFAEMFNW